MALGAAMVLGVGGAPVAAKAQQPGQLVPRLAAVLTVISGDVMMRTARGEFRGAADGAVLHLGSTIRTSQDARAVITFFEGSSVELEPASDITIVRAMARSGSTALLAESFGRGWYVLTHLTVADSRYELRTPAATASVRGIASVVADDDTLDALTSTSKSASITATTPTTEGRVAKTVAAVASVDLVTPQSATVRAKSAMTSVRSAVGAVRVRASGFRDGRGQTTGARTKTVEWSRDRVRQIDLETREDGAEREDNGEDRDGEDRDGEEREDRD